MHFNIEKVIPAYRETGDRRRADGEHIWTWAHRRTLAVGPTTDFNEIARCYERMPRSIYTLNGKRREEVRRLGLRKPEVVRVEEMDNVLVPKPRTKKEMRGSAPVGRRNLMGKRFKRRSGPNDPRPRSPSGPSLISVESVKENIPGGMVLQESPQTKNQDIDDPKPPSHDTAADQDGDWEEIKEGGTLLEYEDDFFMLDNDAFVVV